MPWRLKNRTTRNPSVPTDEEALIWRMARAHYSAASGGAAWAYLPQDRRDELYDAMHLALRELRCPTPEMITASAKTTARERALVRQIAVAAGVKAGHRAKMAHRFAAMIDRLLHIEGGNNADD